MKSSRTGLEQCNSKIFIAICVEKCGFSLVAVLDSILSVVLRFAASDYSSGFFKLLLSLSNKHANLYKLHILLIKYLLRNRK